MVAIKTHFDGKTIKVPKELREAPPGEVLVIIQEKRPDAEDASGWLKAQESAFAKVWDNEEDAVYGSRLPRSRGRLARSSTPAAGSGAKVYRRLAGSGVGGGISNAGAGQ